MTNALFPRISRNQQYALHLIASALASPASTLPLAFPADTDLATVITWRTHQEEKARRLKTCIWIAGNSLAKALGLVRAHSTFPHFVFFWPSFGTMEDLLSPQGTPSRPLERGLPFKSPCIIDHGNNTLARFFWVLNPKSPSEEKTMLPTDAYTCYQNQGWRAGGYSVAYITNESYALAVAALLFHWAVT